MVSNTESVTHCSLHRAAGEAAQAFDWIVVAVSLLWRHGPYGPMTQTLPQADVHHLGMLTCCKGPTHHSSTLHGKIVRGVDYQGGPGTVWGWLLALRSPPKRWFENGFEDFVVFLGLWFRGGPLLTAV